MFDTCILGREREEPTQQLASALALFFVQFAMAEGKDGEKGEHLPPHSQILMPD